MDYYPAYDEPGEEQDIERSQGFGNMQQFIQSETDPPTAETDPAAIQSVNFRRIFVDSLTSGAVEAVYQSTNKGRVTLNLLNSRKDFLLHVDAHFNWFTWRNTLVITSRAVHGAWQPEVHPKGFPFPCCGYVTTITLRVEIGAGAFIISANGIVIAKYPYRGAMRPPVNQIQYSYEDTGATKKAKLESLTVEY